jgi:hypothetical protein
MTEEKKESFNAETLKTILEKEVGARFAKYLSDRDRTSHTKDRIFSIAQYINAQEIENMLERIISRLGGGALEQGKVFVSVNDKNGHVVTSDSDCEKFFVSVAYGHEVIVRNREYPTRDDHLRARQIQLSRELKRKLDALWVNRKGLGVDFNNPGAMRIELVQDSPKISKISKEIGEERLFVRIDPGLIKVYGGSRTYLEWEFPKDET